LKIGSYNIEIFSKKASDRYIIYIENGVPKMVVIVFHILINIIIACVCPWLKEGFAL